MLTAERLREVLDYDPATGLFRWRITNSNSRGAGKVAGSTKVRSYRQIQIDRRRYCAHRLAWLYMHGAWPSGELDHKNCDSTDDRIANLRPASRQQNCANMRAKNATGLKGIDRRLNKSGVKWYAHIRVDGHLRHLGVFDSPERANAAYVAAACSIHGQFARGS